MRAVVLSVLLTLSGCLMSHHVEAIPTAYDDVKTDPFQSNEVKACTFEALYFMPVTGPRGAQSKRHHTADVVGRLQQSGAHAHVIAETITRSWLIFGSSSCTYVAGQPVPASVMFEEK